jgi:hypothetical protein
VEIVAFIVLVSLIENERFLKNKDKSESKQHVFRVVVYTRNEFPFKLKII